MGTPWLIFRMVIFLTMMTCVLTGAHYYLYRRWVKAPGLTGNLRRIGILLLVLFPVVMVLSIRHARALNDDTVAGWAYVGFGYMGFLFFALILTAIAHGTSGLLLRLKSRAAKSENRPVRTDRRALLARGAAGVSLLGSSALSAEALAQGSRAPALKQIDVPVKGLPDSLEQFRIVQLSDIHIGPTLRADFLNEIVERVNALSPDMVAITGDLVDGSVDQLSEHVRPLGRLKSRYGTFFTTGNHEYYSGADAWIKFLTSLGIKVLRNEHVTLRHNDAAIDIIGVDDWRANRFGGDHGHDLEKAVRGRNRDRVGVLLAHQPKSIHEAAQHQVDLVLSGHTHGGQLWPFRFLVMLVQPYLEGLHQHTDRTSIFVHRGTGYWGIPMRLGVSAEIVELSLTRSLQA
ncbi:MAG: metallophosphoesterase [Bradymonadia bacterium]